MDSVLQFELSDESLDLKSQWPFTQDVELQLRMTRGNSCKCAYKSRMTLKPNQGADRDEQRNRGRQVKLAFGIFVSQVAKPLGINAIGNHTNPGGIDSQPDHRLLQ